MAEHVVQVYYNRTYRTWSVRSKATGHVCDYADVVFLRDCVFKVSESGRQRVLRERRRNVHAYVEGVRILPGYLADRGIETDFWGRRKRRVRYNPYEGPYFMSSNRPVFKANRAVFVGKNCFILAGPRSGELLKELNKALGVHS